MNTDNGFEEEVQRYLLAELGVALHVPSLWEVASSETGTLAAYADAAFFAPAEYGYRSSVVFSRELLVPSNPEQFEELIEGVLAVMQDSPGIEIIGSGRASQNSMPAWILRYRRTRAGHPHNYEQLLVLVVTDMMRGTMLHIDASTISPLAERHLPLLMRILNSLEPARTSPE